MHGVEEFYSVGNAGVAEADSSSLSMSHICNAPGVASPPDLPFRLSGSQRKTAYALEKNCAAICREAGLGHVGFLTLTVGDSTAFGFTQVFNPTEASRRIHCLMTGLLAELFPRAIIVTERHHNGAIHFHLLVECRDEIGLGFDHEAFHAARHAREDGGCDASAESRYIHAARTPLRALWAILRKRLPAYGFGRAELTPVRKNSDAVSRYVAKYVEKNLFNRLDVDRGKKLVRYMGWQKRQLRPNDFSWGTPRASAWRLKARQLAGIVGIVEKAHMPGAMGPRWSFVITRIMHAVGDSVEPGYKWTFPERVVVGRIVLAACRGSFIALQRREVVCANRWDGKPRERQIEFFPAGIQEGFFPPKASTVRHQTALA